MTRDLQAVITTAKGDIRLDIFGEKTPITAANFVNLARRGYYDGLIFHRVIPDFMIQGGCPLGKGFGDPGYKFPDEFVDGLIHDRPGILSMANSGPNSNGSQFFITHKATPWLDYKHTVFGAVTGPEDQSVVDSIVGGDKLIKVTLVGDVDGLLAYRSAEVREWNSILDRKYPAKK